MRDLLVFRRMVTTVIVSLLFWIGVVACVIAGIALIVYGVAGWADSPIDINGVVTVDDSGGPAEVFWGVLLLTAGPLIVRVAAELLILFFRMNETLTDIRNAVLETPAAPGTAPVQQAPTAPVIVNAMPAASAPLQYPYGNGNGTAHTEERVAEARRELREEMAQLRYEVRDVLTSLRYGIQERSRGD